MAYGHWKGKMVRRRSDELFSDYIRMRDELCKFGVKCTPQRLFRDDGTLDVRHLTAAHWKGRGRENTRFDPRNADCACRKCHDWLDHTAEGQQFHDEWKRKQLGENEANKVEFLASLKGDRDDKRDILYCKELLKSLPPSIFI